MSLYIIGDIQGCFDELQTLLRQIDFKKKHDELWFTGDLVNRGAKSLATLRFVMALGKKAITVLGNHDLHLLAIAANTKKLGRKDTLQAILDAPDRKVLMNWLRHRPLLHHDSAKNIVLLHAGLPPQWDLDLAKQCAHEVEAVLQGKNYADFLANMYGDQPDLWSPKLEGWKRLRFITNSLTRLRYCHRQQATLALQAKGPPEHSPSTLCPWFQMPQRQSQGQRIFFGHWATLGYHQENHTYALDSGCLWGGHLTAFRVEDGKTFSIPCREAMSPAHFV